jgi:hypothetical protein
MLVLALEFSRIRAARLDRRASIAHPTGVAAGRAVARQPRRRGTASRSLKTEERGPDLHRRSRSVQMGGDEAAGDLVGRFRVMRAD